MDLPFTERKPSKEQVPGVELLNGDRLWDIQEEVLSRQSGDRLDLNIWESSGYRWFLKTWTWLRSPWGWVWTEKNLGLRIKARGIPVVANQRDEEEQITLPHSSSFFFFFYHYEKQLFCLIRLAFIWTKLLTKLLWLLLLKSDMCSLQLQRLFKRKSTKLGAGRASWCRHWTSKASASFQD